MSRVFIVIPSFNEGRVIRNTLTPLLNEGYHVVLVDDCSSDNTREAISGLNIHYVRHPINLGQGAAIQTGTEYAILQGADYVIHFDADGQHNYRDIQRMLEPLVNGRADVTLGTRFKRKEDVNAVPPLRRFLLKTAIVINGIMTGLWLSDAHNGFRAFSASAASKIQLTENRMAHATEILSLIKNAALRVEEIPVHIVYTDYSRQKGQSSMNAINILLDLILRKIF